MKSKKSKTAQLENKRFIFFEIAVIIVLLGTLLAFEYNSSNEKINLYVSNTETVEVEDVILSTKRFEKPKLPERPKVIQVFDIKDDDIEIDDPDLIDMDIKIDTDVPIYFADDADEEDIEETPFVTAQIMPKFPGGMKALWKFIYNNLEYPQIAIENGVQGRVTLQFVVDKKGKVTQIKILRGVDNLLDKAAVSVVEKLPNFSPAENNGKKVKVYYTLPVTFRLQN
jgi:protein TonB